MGVFTSFFIKLIVDVELVESSNPTMNKIVGFHRCCNVVLDSLVDLMVVLLAKKHLNFTTLFTFALRSLINKVNSKKLKYCCIYFIVRDDFIVVRKTHIIIEY
ncbi:hypothetical protein BpHYR1_043423 [Brachionus plicatilis]|uniref:Uncharacterized protein n=1 Tax=Brachionus plicatilis TaxID=10195 RepID=A0A3M7QAK8_BRAPC|nr:hypothetical protein BpHYR1_043423 [Brachionus plicatilis]